ncbi:acyl-CoA Delta-9 desaturase [Anabrus simplex]|uniref:acyl-CoA Delta-9 desaturase n=1 Tax=Anabrus simplex TaxID=316456 RepID=UPI0034DD751A
MVTIAQTQCITLQEKVEEIKEEEKTKEPYKREIVWFNAIGFLLLHIAAVYGLFLLAFYGRVVTWIYIVVFNLMCGLGVTVGAHRLFTHRCFKAKWGVRLALIILHTVAGQNCLYIWVRDHRQHHKYSDTDADPHNATRGFFFSHIGWLMCRKHPDVKKMGRYVDLSDLEADPIVMFQKKYYKTLYFFFSMCFPIAIPVLCWNEDFWVAVYGCYFFRMITVLNITWLVNSAAHMYGTRPYNNHIEPVESNIVAFLSLGEGWHNYHHCFPWDYRAAELGMKHDLSTKVIDFMARRGWVYDLKFASENMVKKRAMMFGDGTHPLYHPEGDAPKGASHEVDAIVTKRKNAAGDSREFVQALPTKEATMTIG